MTVLSVREYETLRVVESLSAHGQRALTLAEVDALHAAGSRLGIRVIEHSSRTQVRFLQYVGMVRAAGRDIELLPKLESPAGEAAPSRVKHNLLRMLLTASDTKVKPTGRALSATAQESWLDAFIHLYCDELAEQLRRGLAKRYRIEEGDLPTVRGRLLIDEQLTRNAIHQERVACEYDELDEDHLLNQMLKAALILMRSIARSAATSRRVRETLLGFDEVSARGPSGNWWRDVQTDRLTSRFESGRRLAEIFLSGLSPNVTSGGEATFALLFDMNELFEKYVGRTLKRQLALRGLEVQLQDRSNYLMEPTPATSGQGLFLLKPDLVVSQSGSIVCIGDTKWKRLAPQERKLGVSQADLYQMLAYAQRYPCDRILMLYPFDGVPTDLGVKAHRLVYEGRKTSVLIAQLCLDDLDNVPGELEKLFESACTEMMVDTELAAAPMTIS